MQDVDREILDHFLRTRQKTIELTKRISDEHLARQPQGEKGPLSHLLAHAGCSGSWWMANVLRDGQGDRKMAPDDRDSLIQEMEYWRHRVLAFFEASDGQRMGETFFFIEKDGSRSEWTGRNRLLYFVDHEVHHRGKIVLALRQWGFTDFPFLPF